MVIAFSMDLAKEALKWYTQNPSPFLVLDELWDQGLRVQTKVDLALSQIEQI